MATLIRLFSVLRETKHFLTRVRMEEQYRALQYEMLVLKDSFQGESFDKAFDLISQSHNFEQNAQIKTKQTQTQ